MSFSPVMLAALKDGAMAIRDRASNIARTIANEPEKYPEGGEIRRILEEQTEISLQNCDLIEGLIKRNTPAK